MKKCLCGSNKEYAECCGQFISGEKLPETPEQLMRSRYTAFVEKNSGYVVQTVTGPAERDFSKDDANTWIEHVKWQELLVIKSSPVDQNSELGFVEFIAKFSIIGRDKVLHEISEFRKQDGKWLYYDGIYPKTGRNDPCVCGSGKKYKKCCGKNG